MTAILSALGHTIVFTLAAIFVAGMVSGCAATVVAHRALRGSR